MRSTTILVALLAGCAPVPPGDVVGGHAEWVGRWTDPAPTYTGDVRICWVDDDGLHVTAGGHSPNVSVELAGDWTRPEWDTTDIGGGYSHPSGSGFLGYPFYTCEAHIGTGSGEWIVDLECTEPNLSAHIVITGCERR